MNLEGRRHILSRPNTPVSTVFKNHREVRGKGNSRRPYRKYPAGELRSRRDDGLM